MENNSSSVMKILLPAEFMRILDMLFYATFPIISVNFRTIFFYFHHKTFFYPSICVEGPYGPWCTWLGARTRGNDTYDHFHVAIVLHHHVTAIHSGSSWESYV